MRIIFSFGFLSNNIKLVCNNIQKNEENEEKKKKSSFNMRKSSYNGKSPKNMTINLTGEKKNAEKIANQKQSIRLKRRGSHGRQNNSILYPKSSKKSRARSLDLPNKSEFDPKIGYFFREAFLKTIKSDDIHPRDRKIVAEGKELQSKVDVKDFTEIDLEESKEQVQDCLRSLDYVKSLKQSDIASSKKVNLMKRKQKLLVFDMDETLAHCIPDEELEFDENDE